MNPVVEEAVKTPFSPAEKVRVVKFQFCHDDECVFSEHLHLCVKTYEIELKQGNAVAISYTWGEFHRRDVPIGHRADGTAIHLNLGVEWAEADLIQRLALISMENSACWMDQLCIPQKEDEIRLALSKIPKIYRTLEVVAIMPGHPCKCLREATEAVEAAYGTSSDGKPTPQFNVAVRLQEVKMRACANSYGLSSWFKRVWTRQELLYARQIRVEWTSDDEAPCVKTQPTQTEEKGVEDMFYDSSTSFSFSEPEIQKLNPYARHCLVQESLDGKDGTIPRIVAELSATYVTGNAAIGEYAGYYHSEANEAFRSLMLLRFLSGIKLENRSSAGVRGSISDIERFITQLGGLSMSLRAATQARDYVASVWVDCPGYVLPVRYKSMELADLLEDAVLQLEKNHGISLIVHAPAGLFGATETTGLWRPSAYLKQLKVTRAEQVYGSLVHPYRPLKIGVGGTIALRVFNEASQPLSLRARGFRETFSGRSTAEIFDSINGIVYDWPWFVHDHSLMASFSNTLQDYKKWVHGGREGAMGVLFRQLIVESRLSRDPTSKYAKRVWKPGYPEFDPAPAVYEMVADALGLDHNLCRKERLRLMISLEAPACIGFMKRTVKMGGAFPSGKAVTICTGRADKISGYSLLEAVQVELTSSVYRYEIVGVWVPMQNGPRFSEIGAIPEYRSPNGFIV